MTCCVAALCDRGKSIVLVADKMVGLGMIEGEPEITKILKIHASWRVMIAGNDISPAFPIVDSLKRKLTGRRLSLTVENVMDATYECYREERSRISEGMHLAPRGWTAGEFNSPAAGVIPKRTRREVIEKLNAQRLEVSLLVAGFDSSGGGHIFSLDDYEQRGRPRRHDIPGFHAIGTGADGALYMMTYREASSSLPLRLMLYYAAEGKYFGELAGSVGQRTDAIIIRAGKLAFRVKEEVLEKKLFNLCQKLQPRTLSQRHVDVLNSLKGRNFNQIPKLKTKKERGELVIG
jgi:hypothetical protein